MVRSVYCSSRGAKGSSPAHESDNSQSSVTSAPGDVRPGIGSRQEQSHPRTLLKTVANSQYCILQQHNAMLLVFSKSGARKEITDMDNLCSWEYKRLCTQAAVCFPRRPGKKSSSVTILSSQGPAQAGRGSFGGLFPYKCLWESVRGIHQRHLRSYSLPFQFEEHIPQSRPLSYFFLSRALTV